MSNFPLSYQLTWLPRLLAPSPRGASGIPAGAGSLAPDRSRVARLAFIGDISAVANEAAPAVHESIAAALASADCVVGNCESPVVETVRAPLGTLIGRRHAMTARFLSGLLAAASIAPERTVLSLANNHALDQGREGLAETRRALAALGIRTVGAFDDGLLPTVRVGPLSIAFAAFTGWRNGPAADFRDRVVMADDMRRGGLTAMREVAADLVCALPHWDYEFRHFPHAATRALARDLVEAGAHLVIGGHAHVLQPVETLDRALVAFGLGDFVGTAWRRTRWPLRLGAILFVDIATAPEARGRCVGHRILPFFRERLGAGERLVPLHALGPVGTRVERRLALIQGARR